ncbi:MAG: hypothetical protein M3O71_27845 [Bacteroidota bacterium]|nr:hypothetical protein [Bacteroidota bacterium]
MKLKLIKATCSVIVGVLAIGIYAGCKPDKFSGEGNGLTAKPIDASFTITNIKPNYYVLKASTNGVQSVSYDLGDGGGMGPGKFLDTVFYPDAGSYTVTETALGFIGGVSKTSASQTINVPTSDPKSGNLVVGGKFGTGDDKYWTHFIVGSGNNMVIDESKGVMVANESGYQAGGIAQSFDLVANQKYFVDMLVSGSGADGSWFEVWVDTKAPVNGQDYNTGQKPISLNTFAGCGSSAFSGKLSALSCSGSGDPFTVPTSGKYYLVVKCGGNNTGTTGISFTNVTLRGVQ